MRNETARFVAAAPAAIGLGGPLAALGVSRPIDGPLDAAPLIRWEVGQGHGPGAEPIEGLPLPARRATKPEREELESHPRAREYFEAVEAATRERLERRARQCGIGAVLLEKRDASGRRRQACYGLACRIKGCPRCHAFASQRTAARCDPPAGSEGWTALQTLTLPQRGRCIRRAWANIGRWSGKMAKYMLRFLNIWQGRYRDYRGPDAAYVWVVEAHESGWPHVHMLVACGGWEKMQDEDWRAFVAWMRVQWGEIVGECRFPQEAYLEPGEATHGGAHHDWYPYAWIPAGAPNCRWDVAKTETVRTGAYARKYLAKPPPQELWMEIAVWSYRKRRLGAGHRAQKRPRVWDEAWMIDQEERERIEAPEGRQGWRRVKETSFGLEWIEWSIENEVADFLQKRGVYVQPESIVPSRDGEFGVKEKAREGQGERYEYFWPGG